MVESLTHTVVQRKPQCTTYSQYVNLLYVIESQVLTPPNRPDFTAMEQFQSRQHNHFLPCKHKPHLVLHFTSSFPFIYQTTVCQTLFLILSCLHLVSLTMAAVLPLISFCRTFLAENRSHITVVFAKIYYQDTISLSVS